MKTMRKRIISLFLAVLMVVSVIPMGTIEANAEMSGEFYYSVTSEKEKTCTITEYDGGRTTELIIPSQIDGYTVTGIGREAFCNWEWFESVVVPDSVTYIDRYAFYYCTSLMSIELPDSITYIGDHAFEKTDYYYTRSNWENGVMYIGNHLIEAKTSLSGAYTVRPGTKTIASDAFAACNLLESVTLPDSVITIGTAAFDGCESLKSIIISSNVENIWDYAFYRCDKLTVYGYNGSYAQTYYGRDNISFVAFGDADADGVIDANDYAMVKSYIMCSQNLTEEQLIAADYNKDGTVDAFDAIAIDIYLHSQQ